MQGIAKGWLVEGPLVEPCWSHTEAMHGLTGQGNSLRDKLRFIGNQHDASPKCLVLLIVLCRQLTLITIARFLKLLTWRMPKFFRHIVSCQNLPMKYHWPEKLGTRQKQHNWLQLDTNPISVQVVEGLSKISIMLFYDHKSPCEKHASAWHSLIRDLSREVCESHKYSCWCKGDGEKNIIGVKNVLCRSVQGVEGFTRIKQVSATDLFCITQIFLFYDMIFAEQAKTRKLMSLSALE